jgi:2-(1,2-epoxy-1,2-dihydrophenyl)acetyl-CoA isomerase
LIKWWLAGTLAGHLSPGKYGSGASSRANRPVRRHTMEYKYETLQIEIEDGVAIVTLNRPDKMNALSMQMLAELLPAFETLRVDPDVKAVVLTGAGKAFCAGGDIGDMLGGNLKLDYVSGRTLGKTIEAIQGIEKPVVCALNGIAAGGGAGVALACDVIYASEKSRFSEIYTNIGMLPDCGNLWLLPRLVGPYKAKELCFSAEIIDAQEMFRLGIAQKLFAPEELLPKTIEFAKKLASGPTQAYAMIKTFIDRGWGMSLEQFYDLEALGLDKIMQTQDFKEGVAAFVEKRKPEYKGK